MSRWKNFRMLNNFKEDHKIVFEKKVNISNNEIRVIHLLR